jgi:hypothetical protein
MLLDSRYGGVEIGGGKVEDAYLVLHVLFRMRA